METIKTIKTDKWYNVKISYCMDNFIYQNYEIFWDGINFRFRGMDWATSEKLKGISEEIITRALWFDDLYEYDPEEEEEIEKEAKNLKDKYWIYPISTFEHSNYAFHLLYWDKLRGNDGVILLDKEICSDRGNEETDKFLRWNFTDFFNGRMYNITIEKPHKYRDDEGEEITMRDYVDGITAVFWDDINETYNEYFCKDYGKLETSFSF